MEEKESKSGRKIMKILDGSDQFKYLIWRLRLKDEFFFIIFFTKCREEHDSFKMDGADAFLTINPKAQIKSQVFDFDLRSRSNVESDQWLR